MRGNSSAIERRKVLKTLGAAGAGLTAGCMSSDGGGGDGNGGDGTSSGSESSSGDGGSGGGEGEELLIGALQPFSGPFALYSEAHQSGLKFAIQEVNENGGVLDSKLGVKSVDTGAEASEAATIFTRLVQEDGIIAATGPVSSDVGIRAGQVAEKEKVPLFFHASASHRALTKESRYAFRVGALPAPSTMKAVSGLVEQKGYSNVGSIIGDYAWGHAVKKSINQFFPESANVNFGTAPVSESDFTPYLRKFPEDVELVIGTGHPPGVIDIYKQALELDLGHDTYLGSTAPDQAYYNALGKDVTEGLAFFHQADVSSDAFKEVAQRYNDKTGNYFGTTQAVGYVTGKLIAAAVEEAGTADPAAISNAVRNLSLNTIYANPVEYTQWGELKDQIQIWSEIELKAPEYHPDGAFSPKEIYRSDPIKAFDPENFSMD